MIKAIGFDWGGVIVDSKPVAGGIADILGITQKGLLKVYYKYNTLTNVGNMSYEDLWIKVITEFGQPEKAEEVLAYRDSQQTYTPTPEMVKLIDEVKAQGFKTGLLSNNTIEIGNLIRSQGLDKHFDVFLISAEIGFAKPNPEAYNLLIEQLQIKPNELAFIDNSAGYLASSDQVGYHPILFTSYEQLRTDLIQLNIIPA